MNGQRYIGVALDYSASSKYALTWAIDNILREGDQLIVLVVNKEILQEGPGQGHLWAKTGSPLIPLAETEDPRTQSHYQLKTDADVQKYLQEAASVKKIIVSFKVYWGDPKEKICNAVVETPLDFLIMGCRGLSALKRTFMGSVSNYVVNNVPCPVTIVKLPPNIAA